MVTRIFSKGAFAASPRWAANLPPQTCGTIRGLVLRLVLAALALAFAACAAGRPTSLLRLRTGYEILAARCEAWVESCTSILVTGNPHDEEAWGFRARPVLGRSVWNEPEVFYAVGDQARCDEVRAALGAPSEACWGQVYFQRE
jgi:hypothetical protein